MKNKKPTQEEFDEITYHAMEAFWSVVRERLPECRTGDLDMGDAMKFEKASEAVIAQWYDANKAVRS